jgi:hypothetical protein
MLASQSARLLYMLIFVQCAHFMQKFAPTKTRAYKNLQNTFKNDYKNHQTPTPTNPKTRSHLFFECLRQHATERYKKRKIWAFCLFCIILTGSSLWKKHGHDGNFEHCACVCTSPCRWGCTTYFVEDNLKLQAFSMVKFYYQCRGRGVTENSRLQWRA